MKKLFLFLTVAALLSGCDHSDEQSPIVETGRIDLRPGIEALTRSPHWDADGSGTFADGDVFSLTISVNGTYTEMKDYMMPSTILNWEDLKLPDATKEVCFAGCYPKHDEEMGSIFVFNVNHAEGEEKDLLLAPAVKVATGSASPINLPFYHAMHNLVIKYKSTDYTDEELNSIQTTLDGIAECKINLVTGEVIDIDILPESYIPQIGKEISTLVVPQAKSSVSLQVCIGGKTHIYELADLPETTDKGQRIIRLDGGKQLEVVLAVNKSGITLSGITIQGWETQGSVSDDITIE